MKPQVLIMDTRDEALLKTLLTEFASKVITSRKEKTNFKEYFGVVNIEHDQFSDAKYVELAMPDHYINFFNYIIEKAR
jgi:hypothetical protein